MAHSYAPNVGAQVRRMTGDVFAYRENTSEGVREYNEVQHFGLAASVRSFLLASCLPYTHEHSDEKLMANAFAHTQIFRKKGRTRPYVRGDYSVNPNILMSCCVESTNDICTPCGNRNRRRARRPNSGPSTSTRVRCPCCATTTGPRTTSSTKS